MSVPEGGTYDLTIYQGAPFTQTFSLREDDEETIITLNGYTAEAQLRPRPGSETLLATFGCSVDGPNGDVTIELDQDAVDSLTTSGEYDIFLDNGLAGGRTMFLEGKATVNPAVTI